MGKPHCEMNGHQCVRLWISARRAEQINIIIKRNSERASDLSFSHPFTVAFIEFLNNTKTNDHNFGQFVKAEAPFDYQDVFQS